MAGSETSVATRADELPRWQRAAEALGYGVRPLPGPAYLPVHLAGLVPAEQGRDLLDLAARPVPLHGLVAGGSAADTARRGAQVAAELRHRRGGQPSSIGIGPNRSAALVRALYAEVLAQALPRLPEGGWFQLTGWEHALDAGTAGLLAALHRIGARADLWLVEGVAAVPTVAAVLTLPAAPHTVHAVACDLDPARAAAAALWRAVESLAVALLAGHDPGPAGPPAVAGGRRLADVVPADAVSADALRADTVPADAVRADAVRADAVSADAVLTGLRAALRADGRQAEFRSLPGAGPCVTVEAQILPVPAERSTGPWAPPDVAALGLDAPVQLGFSCEPSRVPLSRLYHEHSKLRTLYRDLPPVDLAHMAPSLQRLLATPVREYPYASRRYPLPRDRAARTKPIEACIARRRSWAGMGDGPVSQADLGHLLHFSCGVTGTAGLMGTDVRMPMRATPAAGGLYSTDLFVYAQRVEGVEPGLYYHDPGRHELQCVRDDVTAAEVTEQIGYQERAAGAAAIVVYVASLRRLRWKYWERAYRMAHLDCGHLAQTLVLVANGLDLVAHPMIAFVDDYFNDLVGVDGTDEAVVYLTLLGPRAGGAS